MSDTSAVSGFSGEVHPFFKDPTNRGILILVPEPLADDPNPWLTVEVEQASPDDDRQLRAIVCEYDQWGYGSGEVYNVTGTQNPNEVRRILVAQVGLMRSRRAELLGVLDKKTAETRRKMFILGCGSMAATLSAVSAEMISDTSGKVENLLDVAVAAGAALTACVASVGRLMSRSAKRKREKIHTEFRKYNNQKLLLRSNELIEQE